MWVGLKAILSSTTVTDKGEEAGFLMATTAVAAYHFHQCAKGNAPLKPLISLTGCHKALGA